MVQVGHALIGTQNELLSLDEGFCTILDTPLETIVGRSVLSLTAPPDRAACAIAMRHLRATGQPFRVTKRYLREDGSPVWVSNTVSIMALGDAPPMLVSTIVPIAPPSDAQSPAKLLDCARFLLAARRDRTGAFAASLFNEPAWDMLLVMYIVEAEGGAIDGPALARFARLGGPAATRWLRALVQEGLIEEEAGSGNALTFRLADSTHGQFEAYLSGLLTKRMPEPSVV